MTVRSLSSLADFVIGESLLHCRMVLDAEVPRQSPSGVTGWIAIFALGKLGGESSTTARTWTILPRFIRCRRGSRFCTKLGERLVQAFACRPGRLPFRVDMRLRPHGETGPLVPTVESMVNYYESWGEAWERQALIKARHVAGGDALGGVSWTLSAVMPLPGRWTTGRSRNSRSA